MTLTAYADHGTLLGAPQVRTVPGQGKLTEMVSSLFAGLVTGTGWIKVESDLPVVTFDMFGDKLARRSRGIAGMRAWDEDHVAPLREIDQVVDWGDRLEPGGLGRLRDPDGVQG